MAITSNPADFAFPSFNVSQKTAQAAFYVMVGVIAMGVAIPAAIMTADAGIFEECFAVAQICSTP